MKIGYVLFGAFIAGALVLPAETPIAVATELQAASPAVTGKTLYTFSGNDAPQAGLIMDAIGNLYGTTGHYQGAVFQLMPPASSTGWVEKVLHQFCSNGSCADGADPKADLIIDAGGNLYGATSGGGAFNGGAVFRLSPNGTGWNYTVLYSFCLQRNCADGSGPEPKLIMDLGGNLYGTTHYGGSSSLGGGVVFKLAPTDSGWTETVLYTFCSQSSCADGANPAAGLVMDGSGNLYGTTYYGGAGGSLGSGVVFELAQGGGGWKETVLHTFSCSASLCGKPAAGLVIDGAGNLYGTTEWGGSYGYGSVFRLTPTSTGWTATTLYSFCTLSSCYDGLNPLGGLIMDSAGNLYGTTSTGGSGVGGFYGEGTVFKLSPSSGGWTETVLYNFCPNTNCTDGSYPVSDLVIDAAGNLYGTTYYGGSSDRGVVFAVTFGNYALSVSETGAGNVKSTTPSGIDCPTTCNANFPAGTQVALTATPTGNGTFKGWGGACSGTGTCNLTMNATLGVSATFGPPIHSLAVSVIGSPGGKVTSSPSGIDCGSSCSADFNAGSQVILTAGPATAWGLAGWGGACSGVASTCTLTMDANTSAAASFTTLFSSFAAPVVTSPKETPALQPPTISPIPK